MTKYVTPEQYDQASQIGISPDHVHTRLALGWSVERATTEPPKRYKNYKYEVREEDLPDGVTLEAYCQRRAKGMSQQDAATRPWQMSKFRARSFKDAVREGEGHDTN
ncbi:hypothetical protein [Geomicrobium sp. JCM 19039]|uniref:hypothetical protein n=1 Tax=Geomicrobium sp. JCM 19039 TaxID=1460636 RepID=UPI0005A850E2|nr:hypothetical protein [Geomicrobium sp. JCM 19039]